MTAILRNAKIEKLFLFLFFITATLSSLKAQTWKSPLQQPGGSNYVNTHLYAVIFISNTKGWAVGNGGNILTTNNGGTSWTAQTTGTSNNLRSVHFINATQGWAVGNSGTILSTSNGGTTWTTQTSGTTQTLVGVHFISANQGWVVASGGAILTTNNGGTTWTAQTNPTTQGFNGVYFISATQGWAVGNQGTIITTSNGGSSWSTQTTGTSNILRSVHFISATQGWVVGSTGTILTTSNGGTTWTAQTSGTTQQLNGVYFNSATQGRAVGGTGTILTTSNGGTTWTAQTSGTTETLNSVHFTSATQGWAVGNFGTILTTSNGGTNWAPQAFSTFQTLQGVHFTSASQGWAVGDNGTILTTSNGGTSWNAQTSGTPNHLGSVFFTSATQGWAVGLTGTIRTTSNGGTNWNAQTSGTTNHLNSVFFTSATQGWAAGQNGTILITSNGGTNWSTQTSGTTSGLTGLFFTSATQGWAVGEGGTILTTGNGGTTWSAQTSGTTQLLRSVYFTSATQGWAVGGLGTILTTSNGGTTWTAQTSGTTNSLNTVYFTSASQGWAIGGGGIILTTSNGGTTWTTQTSGITATLNDVYFTGPTQGWAVGQNGTILLYGASTSNTPVVSTAAAGSISAGAATLGGNVTDSGSTAITQRGVVYATTANPTLANTKVSMGTGLGSFSQNVSGLSASTLYHFRAFAINSTDTAYGADSTFTTAAGGGLAANLTVGPGGNYTSFTNAGGLFEAINASGLSQNTLVTVIGNTNELGTHSLNQFAGNYSLTIKPDAASLRTIEMVSPTKASDTLFIFNGADYVTIDGSFNGTGRYLLFRCANSNQDSTGSVFSFVNDARENTIANCIIESNAKEPYRGGSVSFGRTNLPWGNDGLTIYGNLFRESTGANAGGYAGGVAGQAHYTINYNQKSSRVTIRKNVFTGFQSGSFGINVIQIAFAGDSLTIDSNQIYRGSNFSISNSNNFQAIATSDGSNAIIANNSIGGSDSIRSGAPLIIPAQFTGIVTNTIDTGTTTLIKNNHLSNIVSPKQQMYGLSIRGDKIYVENNIIGGKQNPWDTIQASGTMIAVYLDGFNKPDTGFVRNNIVSHISYRGKTIKDLTGITISRFISNSPETGYCYDNLVSDMFSNSLAQNSFFGAVNGIQLTAYSFGGRDLYCYGNTIKNLTHKTDTNRYQANHIAGAVNGIFLSGGSTIYKALFFNNRIFNLNALNTNIEDTGLYSPQVNGIAVNGVAGNVWLYNNQVSLVSSNNSAVRYSGIACKNNGSNFHGNLRIVHNSVVLSGNTTSNGVNGISAALNRELKQSVFLRNNIFVNARTGGNTNVAITNDSMAANWVDTSCQYNLYISNDANKMGLWTNRTNPLNFASWKSASNSDSVSAYYTTSEVDPSSFFTDIANCDLSIKSAKRNYVSGKGYPEYSAPTDYLNNPRSVTAPSIGAFEYAVIPAYEPTVSTSKPSFIGVTNATLGGHVSDSGTATVTERGVVYSTTANPTTANNKVIIGSGVGSFSQNITGLTASTTYHVRAYAINSVGTSYGGDSMFTTTAVPPSFAPTVSTSIPTLIGSTNATLGGNVSDSGTATVTERGVVYSTTANPTTSNNKVIIGSGTGSFSQNVTGLSASTTYHVRAYAINSAGTSYGADSTFTTAAVSVPTISLSGMFDPFTTCQGTASGAQQFTVGGTNLSGDIMVSAPSGFELSLTLGGAYASSLNLTPTSGVVSATTLYIRISSAATGMPAGNITASSTGASSQNIAISGVLTPAPSKPIISIKPPNPICVGATFLNFGASDTASAGVSYQWSTSGNAKLYAQGSTKQFALVSFPDSGSVKVILTATSGGCTSSDEVSYTVSPEIVHFATVRYFNKNFICEANLVNKYQWGYDIQPILKGESITGEINQNYFNASPDFTNKNYWVISTAGSCYQKTYYNKPSSLVEAKASNAILSIYPNPVNDKLTIHLNESKGMMQIQVIDLHGKVCREVFSDQNETEITLDTLTEGIYLVRCLLDNEVIANTKVVKK